MERGELQVHLRASKRNMKTDKPSHRSETPKLAVCVISSRKITTLLSSSQLSNELPLRFSRFRALRLGISKNWLLTGSISYYAIFSTHNEFTAISILILILLQACTNHTHRSMVSVCQQKCFKRVPIMSQEQGSYAVLVSKRYNIIDPSSTSIK